MQETLALSRINVMFASFHQSLSICLLALILQPAWAKAADDPERHGHLFILSGQSNMTGSLKSGFTSVVKKALGDDQVNVVLCARPGRGIRFWCADYSLPAEHPFHEKLKGGNGEEFTRLVNEVKKACDARTFKTVSFIWMQGESDANRDLGVAYERSFKMLVSRLKAELGIDEMHFVIGRISDHGLNGDGAAGWTKMRAIQQKIAEEDPLGSWIDTDDLNGGNDKQPQGELHYPAKQAVTLGERFGRAALKQLSVEVVE